MTVVDLVGLIAETLDQAVLVTDASLNRPWPTILYANHAFALMSGYAVSELVGRSPAMPQGRGANRPVSRGIGQDLRADGRFHGVLLNHRKTGEPYLRELDVRAMVGRDGKVDASMALKREVCRRGRPGPGRAGRFQPISHRSHHPAFGGTLSSFASVAAS